MRKQIFKLFLCLQIILLLLSGCNLTEDRPNLLGEPLSYLRNPEGSKILIEASHQNTDFNKRISFSYPHLHGDKAGNDPVYELISNKFNVDIQYIPVTWDNWHEKINTWIVSGDLPDILWWDLRAAQYAKFAQWCRDGIFKEIKEPLDKYPDLKQVLDWIPVREKFKVDGKDYIIPHYTRQPEMEGMDGVFLYYRKDWAIKLGMDKDVFTFEDFKEFVKACIDKDPGGNGNTAGVVGPTWTVPDHVFMLEGNPYFASFVKINGKYVWGATLPETLEGIKICQQLYREGIIYKDFYAVNDMDGERQFLNGKAAVMVGSVDAAQLKDKRDYFMVHNPDIDPNEAVYPMKVLGPHGKTLITEDYSYWSVSSFNPKMDEETMERILHIMNWCCTDEAGEIFNYGIRGKDWDLINGSFKQLWEADENGVPKKPLYMLYSSVYCNMGTNGGQFRFSTNFSYDRDLREDILEWVAWRKTVPNSTQKTDMDLDFLDTPNKSKYGSFSQDVKNEIKRLIISSNNIEKDWNDWLKMMTPRVGPILQEINSALAD